MLQEPTYITSPWKVDLPFFWCLLHAVFLLGSFVLVILSNVFLPLCFFFFELWNLNWIWQLCYSFMLSALTVKHIATKCSGKMILGDRNYKWNSLHLESVMWNTCLSASTCCIQFVDLFKLLREILSCIPFLWVLELSSSYGDLLPFFLFLAKEMK